MSDCTLALGIQNEPDDGAREVLGIDGTACTERYNCHRSINPNPSTTGDDGHGLSLVVSRLPELGC
jgi:hypothetical protein